MAKILKVRKVYKAFPSPAKETGLARVGETSIAIPVETWVAVGEPKAFVLNSCGHDLHLFCAPPTGRAHAVAHRRGRTRVYIHTSPSDRRSLIPDLYIPVVEFDERLGAYSICLRSAIR